MSTQITTAFVKQFTSNVFHLAQQKGSRLRGMVRIESQKGKSAFYDRVGLVTATKKVSRHSDTPQIDTPHSRRRVTLSDYEHGDLVDDADKVRLLIDPASEYSKAFIFAFGRAIDDEIILAADGNAFGGEEGGTTVTLPNSQRLAAVSGAAGSNMNVQAMRRAKKILDANDVDPSEPRHLAMQASQLENLLSETETTSSDFNSVKALVQGELDSFLGFQIVRLERLNVDASGDSYDTSAGTVGAGGGTLDTNDRKCLAWAREGLLLALGQDIRGRIAERADKSFSTQVFASMTIGATRMEEEKVVQINSGEA